MDFIFGCWSRRRSSVDCRLVADRLSGFFNTQGMPFRLFPLGPHFAVGVASQMVARDNLGDAVLDTDTVAAVGDVTLYDEPGHRAGDLRRLAEAHDNDDRLAALNGDFAAAVYDQTTERLTLVRDHAGNRPFHFSHYGDACAFSTSVPPLLLAPWATRELDRIGLATFLFLHSPGRERTCFTSAKVVMPACRVRLGSADASAENVKYWMPHAKPGLLIKRETDAHEVVRAELVRAVTVRAAGVDKLGVMLSGGLDSSTVTGIACTLMPDRRIDAVSSALPLGAENPIDDERAYIEAMRERFSNLHVKYETSEGADVLEGADFFKTWLGMPLCDPYFYMTKRLIESTARRGTTCILTGFGGDNCVSVRVRGAILAESLRAGHPLRVARELARLRHANQLGALATLRYHLLPGLVPHGMRQWLRKGRASKWHESHSVSQSMASDPELVRHLRLCGFIAFVAPNRSLAERELELLRGLDIGGISIWNAFAAAQLSSLDIRYPLFDRNLIETCLAVPSQFKASFAHDRALIRGAAQPYIPNSIARRHDKGWFSPDFQNNLRTAEPLLRKILSEAGANSFYRQLTNANAIENALPLLKSTTRQGGRFDTRLLSQIMAPTYVACYLAAIERGTSLN